VDSSAEEQLLLFEDQPNSIAAASAAAVVAAVLAVASASVPGTPERVAAAALVGPAAASNAMGKTQEQTAHSYLTQHRHSWLQT
jgi:hypothetical protein